MRRSRQKMVNTRNNIVLKITHAVHISFRVTITFVKANGERIKAKGEVGNSILDIVVNNDLDLDGYGMNILHLQDLSLIIMHKFGETFSNLEHRSLWRNIDVQHLSFDISQGGVWQSSGRTYRRRGGHARVGARAKWNVCFKNSFELHSLFLAGRKMFYMLIKDCYTWETLSLNLTL